MKLSQWITRLSVLASAFTLLGLGFALGNMSAARPVVAQDNTIQTLTDIELIYAEIYNSVSPSVVSIEVDQRSGASFVPVSGGSGFVYDQQGHIVTNYHVVEGGDRIAINFLDGTIVRAEVVGLDPASDVAVLRVSLSADLLHPVAWADSDTLVVGQTALAIGSPFGERWTLTTGIISALDRTITGLTTFNIGAVIQTDTAINPGNSGGPLLNLRGEVMGINSQIVSESRSNAGVGFAIPSNLVQRVVRELIQTGRVNYSYLGINGEDVNLDFIERYNLPNNLRGVVITGVNTAGPAGAGGLRDDTASSVDVVVAIDGQAVIGMSSLVAYLATNTVPGQTVTMTVLRDGQYIDLRITLTERP